MPPGSSRAPAGEMAPVDASSRPVSPEAHAALGVCDVSGAGLSVRTVASGHALRGFDAGLFLER